MNGHEKRQLSLLLKKKNGQKIVHLEVRKKKILIIMLGDEEGKAIANQSRLSPSTEGNKGLYDLLNLKGETGPAGLCVRRSPSPSPRGACDEVQHLGKRPLSCCWGLRMLFRNPQPRLCRWRYNSRRRGWQLTAGRQQRRDGDARQRGRRRKPSRESQRGRQNSLQKPRRSSCG